ncbi:MAG: UDP-N-acetylglucosamine--N-acetylmuramyl-(pentapeptide) pyrophosphoryl-undecaprenol N-acetylglucosamine transferase [Clostridia bacterium]|nr:UDP-N-acetylglucosamine--N-acetylmuramyl-(pentapeptide) pyrophosphoryl-undecaprenol N-acetylglucosamine transferase [Clostridia bacterium]
MKKIVFTGGGTLGHVMPNLYLVEDLKNDYEIFYIGSNGIEKEKVKAEHITFEEIPSVKLVRGKFFVNLKIPFVLIKAIFSAKRILKRIKPNVVFSKGGYVALPVVIAAKMLKIPVVAHESDFSFGLANKIILKFCNTMCVNFANLEGKNKKITYTGPIFSKNYESTLTNTTKLNLDLNKPTMLIVGGSLGCKIINEKLMPILKDLLKKLNIIHICGKGNKQLNSFENYNVFEVADDMVNLYNLSTFVLGRSGAGVTAECYFKCLPMLLVPLENKSSRGDQLQNANYYVKKGVAKIIREADLTPTTLKTEILNFYADIHKYQKAYSTQKSKNGREQIIEIIKKF